MFAIPSDPNPVQDKVPGGGYRSGMKRPVRPGLPVLGTTLGAAATVFGSLCCVGPLGLAVLGVEGLLLAGLVQPYRPVILLASLLLLGMAVGARNPRAKGEGSCDVRQTWRIGGLVWMGAAAWFVALVLTLLFP